MTVDPWMWRAVAIIALAGYPVTLLLAIGIVQELRAARSVVITAKVFLMHHFATPAPTPGGAAVKWGLEAAIARYERLIGAKQ